MQNRLKLIISRFKIWQASTITKDIKQNQQPSNNKHFKIKTTWSIRLRRMLTRSKCTILYKRFHIRLLLHLSNRLLLNLNMHHVSVSSSKILLDSAYKRLTLRGKISKTPKCLDNRRRLLRMSRLKTSRRMNRLGKLI